MKRIAFYILFFVLLAACQQREESTRHPKEAGTLEVSFAYGGNDHVKSHTFTSAGQSVEMEVRMNVEVGWKVSSDADWCIVDEEKIHHGNGTFQLAVKANDGFLDRDDATVTLSAGDFTTGLRVIQNGNIFILDKLYELSGRAAGSTRIVVNVRDDVSWSLECPEWISASRGDTEHNSGYSSTVVTLDWGENLSASRMGTVGFLRQGERTPSIGFSLYQFGNEYGTTEGGAILLAAKNPSPIEVKVPVNTFTGVNCPKWVSYESVVNDDNTASWYFYFTDNPSDTETVRDTEIEFVSASPYANVNMPPVKQDFYPAGGLLTAAGFKMFAERFNANGDISSWEKDGVVNVVGHVDMSGLDEWTPIGTADRPFNLKFDGRFMTISRFNCSSPLFGVCRDADISGIVFDHTCSVVRNQDFVSTRYLAPLAERIQGTQVRDCKSEASVGINASAVTQGCDVYMSSLVAYMDETSSVRDCIAGGNITCCANRGSEKVTLYIGGVAGLSLGNIESCRCNVTIADSLTVGARYVGGLVGYSGYALDLDFTGSQAMQSTIYAEPADNVYIGGLIGYAASPLTLKAPSWTGNIVYNISADNVVSQTGVSGIVGYSAESLKIEGASAAGKISVKANNAKTYSGAISAGGIVGVAAAGAEISGSNNSAEISWNTHCANSNGHVSALGGIAGRIDKGAALIESCTNTGFLLNGHVNNNGYVKGQLKGDRTGGIIGFYGLDPNLDKQTSHITVRDCHNTAGVNSKRGFCGGIAGFLVNASVQNCTYTGNISNEHSNPYAAGIAAGLERSTVEDCDVTASLYGQYQGSCYVRVGGIVAILYDTSSIQNCRYFGNISGTAGGTPRYGCMVGDTEAGCSISHCGMGGTLQGSEVTGSDFSGYVYGIQYPVGGPPTIPDDRPAIQVSECYYWNGIKN